MSASFPAPDRGPAGATVGAYRLLHRLGEGGMGVVHLALDVEGRAVALKVLRPHVAADPLARQRLSREVSVLRRVRHPQVAEVLDADVAGDPPFVVTRFVPGEPLDDYVRAHGPLSRPHLAVTARTLAGALAAIHAAGIVHRDVKPANVMVLDGLPVLIDFGIAHIADESRITHTGLVMGTPGYLSPELADGAPVTAATDWWGWAATLAFAATGRTPFGTGPIAVVLDRVQRGAPDLTGIEPRLLGAFTAALTADPAMRPPHELLLAGLEGRPAVRPVQRPAAPAATRVTQAAAPQAARPALTEPVPAVTQRVAPPPRPTEPVRSAPTRAIPPEPVRTAGAAALPAASPPAALPSAPGRAATGTAPPGADADRQDGPDADPHALGVLLLVLAGFSLMAAVAPPGAATMAFLAMAVARTVDRCVIGLLRRRHERGRRDSDTAVTLLALPWTAVRAVGATLLASIVPALVAISVAFMAGLLGSESGGPQPSSRLALTLGAAAGLLIAWWGPGGASLRGGTRSIVRAATRRRTPRVIAYGLLGLVVLAALLTIGNGNPPDWGSLADQPLLQQLVASNR
jgi:hypothetical protein